MMKVVICIILGFFVSGCISLIPMYEKYSDREIKNNFICNLIKERSILDFTFFKKSYQLCLDELEDNRKRSKEIRAEWKKARRIKEERSIRYKKERQQERIKMENREKSRRASSKKHAKEREKREEEYKKKFWEERKKASDKNKIILRSWLGQKESKLVVKLGSPQSTHKTGDGSSILIYKERIGAEKCILTVTVKNGLITDVQYKVQNKLDDKIRAIRGVKQCAAE